MGSGGGCGLWVAVEVVGVLGLLLVLQNLQMRQGETNKVRWERNNKKINKEIIFKLIGKKIEPLILDIL